jgi:hypothetical protein
MVTRIKAHISKIRSRRVATGASDRVAFTAGFDGTVLSKLFQVYFSSQGSFVVGGAYPNHNLPVPLSDKEESNKKIFLRQCLDGKYGKPAAEIKGCVLSFQGTPQQCAPYYTLAGQPQSINEQNTFGEEAVRAICRAVQEDGKAVLLNTTTDGVSSEVQWNLKVIIDYLDGKINYVSLPDTNYNVKNARYQLIGRLSPASIGQYVFDPMLLSMSKVNQKLW